MMMLLTGNNLRSNHARAAAFTLIELILVMALLLVVMAVAFPSLQDFFRGRKLDSEARRFLALTRYGQSRAISEGIPTILWLDKKQGRYGLESAPGYDEIDNNAKEYDLNPEIEIDFVEPRNNGRALKTGTASSRMTANLPKIEFTPDGFIAESSPESVIFKQREDEIEIAIATNRLSYAIQTNQPSTRR